jgi:hypothetical protein
MSALPTLSTQKANFIIRNNPLLEQHRKTIPLPASTILEGEWVICDGTGGYARVTGDEATIKQCFPVCGKPAEAMRQVMQDDVTDTPGQCPIYFGPFPIQVDTKMYDTAGTYTVGCLVYIKSITIDSVPRAIITSSGSSSIPCGRVTALPANNDGFLGIDVSFV